MAGVGDDVQWGCSETCWGSRLVARLIARSRLPPFTLPTCTFRPRSRFPSARHSAQYCSTAVTTIFDLLFRRKGCSSTRYCNCTNCDDHGAIPPPSGEATIAHLSSRTTSCPFNMRRFGRHHVCTLVLTFHSLDLHSVRPFHVSLI
jgi:hypothetical protein